MINLMSDRLSEREPASGKISEVPNRDLKILAERYDRGESDYDPEYPYSSECTRKTNGFPY